MLFSRLACLFNKHRPIRSKVRNEGGYLIGNCRYCKTRIRRCSKKNWVRDTDARKGEFV